MSSWLERLELAPSTTRRNNPTPVDLAPVAGIEPTGPSLAVDTHLNLEVVQPFRAHACDRRLSQGPVRTTRAYVSMP
jgi:hypothetical protein